MPIKHLISKEEEYIPAYLIKNTLNVKLRLIGEIFKKGSLIIANQAKKKR